MIRQLIITAGVLLVLPPAWAEDTLPADTAGQGQRYQADVIQEGELVLAEKKLLALIEQNPHDPYAMLNLAYVYQQSGQSEKARTMYARVLELRQNPIAELSSGKPERVKRIARRGMAAIDR